MEEAEAKKIWEKALGRYDRAMLKLVADVMQETERPEEKLASALKMMRTFESALRAKEAIQNG